MAMSNRETEPVHCLHTASSITETMKFSALALTAGLGVVSSSTAFVVAPNRSPILSTPSATSSTTTALSVARNANFAKLAGGYLFPEIGRRRAIYVKDHPETADRKIISLGIGDTTQPIPPHILSGLTEGAVKLGTPTGYTGYGDVQGRTDLRQKIATTLYHDRVEADEVFVSGTYPAITRGRFSLHTHPTAQLWVGVCVSVLFTQTTMPFVDSMQIGMR